MLTSAGPRDQLDLVALKFTEETEGGYSQICYRTRGPHDTTAILSAHKLYHIF
jgi:hypothetical protein